MEIVSQKINGEDWKKVIKGIRLEIAEVLLCKLRYRKKL